MKGLVLKKNAKMVMVITDQAVSIAQYLKNRRNSTRSWLTEMSDFWKHGKLLKNGHNPGG
jgi:hypothetical protein